VIVDSSLPASAITTVRDFACCSRNDDRGLFGTPVLLQRITSAPPAKREAFEAAAEQTRSKPVDRLLKVKRSGTD